MDFLPLVDLGTVILFAGLCAAAAYSDVKNLTIPNRYSLAIALLYPVHVAASGGDVEWLQSLGLGAGFLAGGFVLFTRGWLGGGDVKLLSASVLWAGWEQLPALILITGMTAGAMTLFLSVLHRVRQAPSLGQIFFVTVDPSFAKQPMPFGLAISTGALYVAFTLLV